MYPTIEEWGEIVDNTAKYIKYYLSNPELWFNKYVVDGEPLFYDVESYNHMPWKAETHLVDHWVVDIWLDGTKIRGRIDNTKVVKGKKIWKLMDLLLEGTDDYEGDTMSYWYRFDKEWRTSHERGGIRPEIIAAFKQLMDDGVSYGSRRAYKEWEIKNGI